jgi:hypothetical protein
MLKLVITNVTSTKRYNSKISKADVTTDIVHNDLDLLLFSHNVIKLNQIDSSFPMCLGLSKVTFIKIIFYVA